MAKFRDLPLVLPPEPFRMGEDRRGIEATPAIGPAIGIELSAVIVAVIGDTPQVLTVAAPGFDARALPLGALDPQAHPTLERGLRGWVTELTGLKLGYVEQLYTFGDRGRDPAMETADRRLVSISYLALTSAASLTCAGQADWSNWYAFFPWEDWRAGRPNMIRADILPLLEGWTAAAADSTERDHRRDRVAMAFGAGRVSWDPDRVLDRYELLYEANAVAESRRAAGFSGDGPVFGEEMAPRPSPRAGNGDLAAARQADLPACCV